jgi:hypothetical protein
MSACSQRIGDFTVASIKNMDIKKTLHRVDEQERLIGKDMREIFVIFPTGEPSMKEAMDRAIEQRQGAVGLSNVTVQHDFFYIPWIYGQSEFIIEGNPV